MKTNNHHGGGMKNEGLLCSFCGKTDFEVKALICGPAVYICNECVELCVDILTDYKELRLMNDAEIIKFNELWGTDI